MMLTQSLLHIGVSETEKQVYLLTALQILKFISFSSPAFSITPH